MNHKDPVLDLTQLRHSLKEKFPTAHRDFTPEVLVEPESWQAEDLLNFDPATVNEVVSPEPGRGISLMISRLLDAERDLPLALVDGRDQFDPGSQGNSRCGRLFWVRCHDIGQAIQATDLLLRDGNLPLVVLDLHLSPERELRRIPRALWHRYKTEARQSGTTLVVLTPSVIVPSAHERIFVSGHFTLEQVEKERPTFQASRENTRGISQTRSS
ncbi:MAG: hypothetical protein ACON5H_09295 [Akkermansiaceae bacterium]